LGGHSIHLTVITSKCSVIQITTVISVTDTSARVTLMHNCVTQYVTEQF